MVSLKEFKVDGFRVKINDNNLVTNPPNNLDSVNVSGYSCIYGLTFDKLFEDKVLIRYNNEVYEGKNFYREEDAFRRNVLGEICLKSEYVLKQNREPQVPQQR